MKRLLKLAKMLRDPEHGCPWDRAQNFDTFKECLVNEAREAVAAIEKRDFANLREELGDTLFNIVFLINLAEEAQLFTLEDVIEGVYHKMIKRHPHVFGDQKAQTAAEAYQMFIQAKKSQDRAGRFSRSDAWDLLCEHTASDALRKHALAVESAMAACAKKYGGDEEKWRMAGLLHDLDYERFPDQHPLKAVSVLKERGYDGEIQRAILCHVESTGFEPQTPMEKSICAVDELCGFLIAVALVRPSKKLADVTVPSVIKKIKDKAFARSVDRKAIERAPALLGTSLEEHIAFVLDALKSAASELGV